MARLQGPTSRRLFDVLSLLYPIEKYGRPGCVCWAVFPGVCEAALGLGTRTGPRVGSSKGKGKA